MPRLRIFRITLAVAALAGCRVAVHTSPAPSAPTEMRKAWQDAFNRADTAALVALYAEDAVLVPPSGTVLTGGHVAARMRLGAMMEDRTLRLGLLHQRFAGPGGHLQGTWEARGRSGGALLGSGTWFMLVGRETDGRWRILYHVWREDRQPGMRREDAVTEP
jgi:ketosteroid isomerase-like protein